MARPEPSALDELIRRTWGGWEDQGGLVELDIYGTDDPERIEKLVTSFCAAKLGRTVIGALGYHASVGSTSILALDDGTDIALKAYQPPWTVPFLRAVMRVQRHLAAAGFPVATPRAGPDRIGRGLATIDAAVPDTGSWSSTAEADRRASVAALELLVRTATPLIESAPTEIAALAKHPLQNPSDALWGTPHSPVFDFALPTPHAAAIDELARAARAAQRRDETPPVIAHTDWSARNIRIDQGRFVTAFDWDSLALLPESQAAGQAALTWNATGDPDGPPRPLPDEVAAYVAAYETARGRPFSAVQRRAVGGAALGNLCYIARCEAAIAARWPERDHGHEALDRLEADGDALLDLDRLLG